MWSIIANGNPQEIAALALAIQERQIELDNPLETVRKAVQTAIDGTVKEELTAS